MALFKILSNMDDTSKSLPNTYHQGYCYFDVNTKKFWIDTAPDTATAADKAAGRLPLNALRADFANVATRIPFLTCTSAADAANKEANFGADDEPSWLGSTPPAGTMIAVYFLYGNTAVQPNLLINKGFFVSGTTRAETPIYLTSSKTASPGVSDSWDAGSVVLFTFIPASTSGLTTNKWVMPAYQDPTDYINALDVSAIGVAPSAGNQFICQVSEADGLIDAELSTMTIGDAYAPVYVNSGVITTTYPVQQAAFSISNGQYGVRLSHTAFTAASYVLSIVIETGAQYLTSGITWTSASGYIDLRCDTTIDGGAVTGYIIVARGITLDNSNGLTSAQLST